MTALEASRPLLLLMLMAGSAPAAMAQSSIEHHAWQESRFFEPFSRTAQAITGGITLSGNPEFAQPGSTMTLTFQNGTEVELTSEGAYWRTWDFANDEKVTAEVFRLSTDPGVLEQGNTLCGGNEQATFVVFFEDLAVNEPILRTAIFASVGVPQDINSPGLCGTYSYE